MSRIFFTSDTHFGHSNIIKYCHRPFLSPADQAVLEQVGRWHNGDWKGKGSVSHRLDQESVRLMDEALLERINATVAEDDVLWHLGDFCFGKKDYYKQARHYRDRIRCRTVKLIWGNHDHRSIRDLFKETYDLYRLHAQEQVIVLCHYAMAVWESSHHGSLHLYGHSHSQVEGWLDGAFPNRKSMDVGVDNAYKLLGEFRPFSMEEILQFIGSRPGEGVVEDSPREETLI